MGLTFNTLWHNLNLHLVRFANKLLLKRLILIQKLSVFNHYSIISPFHHFIISGSKESVGNNVIESYMIYKV
jgi:hypothetical protein